MILISFDNFVINFVMRERENYEREEFWPFSNVDLQPRQQLDQRTKIDRKTCCFRSVSVSFADWQLGTGISVVPYS